MYRYLCVLLLIGCSGGAFHGEEHIWSGVDDSSRPVGPTSVEDARTEAEAAPDAPQAAPLAAPRAPEPTRTSAPAREEDAGIPPPSPEQDAAPPPFPQPVETPAVDADADAGPPVPIDPCQGWVPYDPYGLPIASKWVKREILGTEHCGAAGTDADGMRRFDYSQDCVKVSHSVTTSGQALPVLAPGTWYLRSDKGVACR